LCCHAGCEWSRIVAILKTRGLWHSNDYWARKNVGSSFVTSAEVDRTALATGRALRIFEQSADATGTLVQAYFGARGIIIPVPSAIRFHFGLKHPTGDRWPTMVALVTRGTDGSPLGIHRTFLARDGFGKAPVAPNKMMLGPCRGGVVRLARLNDVLLVGEGIETCLAAMLATGYPCWAALSTSGLRSLRLPARARDVIVLADGDDPGESAAVGAAQRWRAEGRRVRIAMPPRGLDFNDLLKGHFSQVSKGKRHV
jgi:putative DNA primase/helicase